MSTKSAYRLYICLAIVWAVPADAEPPAVYALLVADSDDPAIGPGVAKDARRMEQALRTGIGSARLHVKILEGEQATPAAILDFYDALTIRPSTDVLLFHYAGHAGMYDGPRGHVLQMKQGALELKRSDLRDAMRAKDPALVVMITDCCSSKIPARQRREVDEERSTIKKPDRVAPGYDRLFFRTRGIVDITAAEDDKPAIGDNEVGGLFTYAVGDALIKSEGRGDLTWSSYYVTLKNAMDQERVRRDFRWQTSRAFVLPGASWGFTVAKDGDVIRVDDVCLDSDAERAGLRSGDAIIGVGGERVGSTREIARAVGRLRPGDPLELTVRRDGDAVRVVIARR